MNRPFVQIVMNRAKPGVSDEEIRQATELSFGDLAALPGFIRREVLLDDNGQWIDIAYWRSAEDAANAPKFLAENAKIKYLFSLLDETDIAIYNLNIVAASDN